MEGSAQTYQLAIRSKGELNPFNYEGAWNGTRAAELTLATEWFNRDLKGKGGRYPGSWTLPVCNTLDWGKRWNYDYTEIAARGNEDFDLVHFPPCLCGKFRGNSEALFSTPAYMLETVKVDFMLHPCDFLRPFNTQRYL